MANLTFNIEEFKAQLINGGARPNQFTVILNSPPGVDLSAYFGDAAQFLVTATELPGQTVNYTPVFYRGREVKLAGDRQIGPLTMNILNDTQFRIRRGLEAWMNSMDKLSSAGDVLPGRPAKSGLTSPRDYQANMEILQLDRNGAVLVRYLMKGVFPTNIGAVQLDYQSNDVISSFGAEFQYQEFTVDNRGLVARIGTAAFANAAESAIAAGIAT